MSLSIQVPLTLFDHHKFDDIDPVIKAAHFPVPNPIRKEYKLFPIERDSFTDEIVKGMEACGTMPAGIYEGLLYHAWDGTTPLVCLSAIVGINGDRRVVVFDNVNSKRLLKLESLHKEWNTSYQFLGVR